MSKLNQLVAQAGVSIGVGWLVSLVYVYLYAQIADFTEKVHAGNLFFYQVLVQSGAFILFAASAFFSQRTWVRVTVNGLFAGASLAVVFLILSLDDVVFQDPDAQLFAEYFKGFLMPLAFIPQLAWFVVQPLFEKKS